MVPPTAVCILMATHAIALQSQLAASCELPFADGQTLEGGRKGLVDHTVEKYSV